ncbi:MAG: Ig-like domain-containing protein [Chloroflexota bacterium]
MTRTSVVALALAIVLGLSQQAVSQASRPMPEVAPASLLPANVGMAIPSNDAIRINFNTPMNPASVDAGLRVLPETPFATTWSADGRSVELTPSRRWSTDERYLVLVPGAAATASGLPLGKTTRYSFTTQTAPIVAGFQVTVNAPAADAFDKQPKALLEAGSRADEAAAALAPPPNTKAGVSRRTAVTLGFSVPMDQADVEEHFAITPSVDGSFSWNGNQVTFTPETAFEADARYSVSVAEARDALGNRVGGDPVFSFTTRVGAQVVRSVPAADQADVSGNVLQLWFSAPMNTDSVDRAFALWDRSAVGLVGGNLSWNDEGTQLTFIGDADFPPGRQFELELGSGALDSDGNAVETSYKFTSVPAAPVDVAVTQRAAPVAPAAPRPAVPVAAPSGDAVQYALNQVNAARAAYGFGALALDGAVSAVAQAHAADQAANGYFSHTSLDGRTREQRLAAGGVSFGASGENQCYYNGMSVVDTLNWCHAQFMAEPYPGQWNHIGNILSPSFSRMGVGIAQAGATVIITWDFVG